MSLVYFQKMIEGYKKENHSEWMVVEDKKEIFTIKSKHWYNEYVYEKDLTEKAKKEYKTKFPTVDILFVSRFNVYRKEGKEDSQTSFQVFFKEKKEIFRIDLDVCEETKVYKEPYVSIDTVTDTTMHYITFGEIESRKESEITDIIIRLIKSLPEYRLHYIL